METEQFVAVLSVFSATLSGRHSLLAKNQPIAVPRCSMLNIPMPLDLAYRRF